MRGLHGQRVDAAIRQRQRIHDLHRCCSEPPDVNVFQIAAVCIVREEIAAQNQAADFSCRSCLLAGGLAKGVLGRQAESADEFAASVRLADDKRSPGACGDRV